MEPPKQRVRQQRFGHRRLLVKPRLELTGSGKQQSTLTQLDFVSTPASTYVPESSDDEIDLDFEEPRPQKRRKTGSRRSIAKSDSTLTQIGFVQSTGEVARSPGVPYIKDSFSGSDDELNTVAEPDVSLSVDAVRESPSRIPQSDHEDAPIASHAMHGSSRASTESWATAVPQQFSTPLASRRMIVPSSQTPSSIAFSTGRKSNVGSIIERSPLHERSVNLPIKAIPLDANTCAVASSPIVVRDFATQGRSVLFAQQQISAIQNMDSAEEALSRDEDGDQDEEEEEEEFNQFTYDPAFSALDRDAARYGWTQAHLPAATQAKIPSSPRAAPHVEEEATDVLHDLNDQLISIPDSLPASPIAMELQVELPQSQISTVPPTQSPRPPASSGVQIIDSLTDLPSALKTSNSSSSLPRPPWNESEQAEWLKHGNNILTRTDTFSDFSLPAPPLHDVEDTQS